MSLASLKGKNNEGVLVAVILALLVFMAVMAPGSLSLGFAGDIIRSGLVNMCLALGVLMVIIAGGFDVSFMAIAITAAYSTVLIMQSTSWDGSVTPFLVSIVIGLVFALPNVLLIAYYRVPTLMATLGTQTIIRGTLLAFVGSTYIAQLPSGLDAVGRASLFTLGSSPVSILILPIILLCVGIAFFLGKTYYGRAIYAIGGDPEAADRAGIPVFRVQALLLLLAGGIAGFAGMVHVSLNRTANPFDLVGGELDVIAAVVIGGALDTGGRGSVKGTVLGVLLIALVRNSLIRLGVASYWHTFAIGLVVLIGVAVQALSNRRRGHQTPILEGAVK
ncbi:ABC transporter permease [Tessaracoccus caeni]|uniref:ABC transporter permease n=1 Tax=Tessaracoccus caeni TaxID=3031239 RepID=UPI0023DBFBA3|nr:ABC transporter permease [Tessaracoccus caeni]MDF1487925.1 ABC transporter permease [Tessaracoccus caeni]